MAMDGLTIRFGVQSQTGVSASATGDIQFPNPSISSVFSVTTVATVPSVFPTASVAVYRFTFSTSGFAFVPFLLAGSGNIIVTFDDPAIRELSSDYNVVFTQFTDGSTYLGRSTGRSQTPIMVRREGGAIDDFGNIVVGALGVVRDMAGELNWANGNFVNPNVEFSCTIYCY